MSSIRGRTGKRRWSFWLSGIRTAVSKACESIRLRACDGLQPKDVAAEASVSRRTLEMRFRELLGRSILDEIYAVRLERVKELLARSDVPIESIAARCGWKSASHLRVFFKAAEGRTMGEWRAGIRTPAVRAPVLRPESSR